jgi:hypothetical protein
VLETLMTLFLAGANVQAPPVGGDTPFTVWIVDDEDVMPPTGRDTMRSEAGRIWSRYGIQLQWSSRFPVDTTTLGMIVILHGTYDRRPLGRVQRVGNVIRRQIVVSDTALRDLLDAADVRRDNPGWVYLYARMFGRVVSHELGHLLLDSGAHSPSGLMRARFVAGDVRFPSSDRFSLTAAEVDTLTARMAVSTAIARNDRQR